MENRPQGREKRVGSGSVNVNRGREVGSGRPSGGASRPRPSGGYRPSSRPARASRYDDDDDDEYYVPRRSRRRGGKLSTPLLILIIAAFLFFSRGGDGGSYDPGSQGGSSGYSSSQQTKPGSQGLIAPIQPNGGSSVNSPAAPVNTTVSPKARSRFFTPAGSGRDTVTIMVYMCGTDLESKSAMATKDLNETLDASVSENVNLLVMTGGCRQWRNNVISSDVNQIYRIANGHLQSVEKNFSRSAMTDPENLAAFIRYCSQNFPASRNMLVLWDHGGGSISAYGYDEKHPGDSMTLDEFSLALDKGGVNFDMIGFDACLMATLETAMVCDNHADYLIASEESEPGTGWLYTGWLNAVSRNTSIPTTELAMTLINDYYASSAARSQVTLSLIDLAELHGTIPQTLSDFAVSTSQLIRSDCTRVSNARSGVRQFAASNKINQVDLINLAERLNTTESKAFAKALRSCVKYNRSNIPEANGISIFFPYENKTTMNTALKVYDSLNFDRNYTECIRSFASVTTGAQIASSAYNGSYQSYSGSSQGSFGIFDLLNAYASAAGTGGSNYGSGSPFGSLTGGYGSGSAGSSIDIAAILDILSAFSGRSMPEELSWMDNELVAASARSIASNLIDPAHIAVSYVNGERALSLTEHEWSLIQTAELNVFVDDGRGYIDLGRDNTIEFLDNGDMSLEFDGTWLCLNRHVVAYYLSESFEDEYGYLTSIGYIPALLNGELVQLRVVFDRDTPYGRVTGACTDYDGAVTTAAKGDIEIESGDIIQPVCHYYSYSNQYRSSYELGDSFTVDNRGLTLENLKLADISCNVMYCLTDVYGTSYWTPAYNYIAH